MSLAIGSVVALAGMTFYSSTLQARRVVETRLEVEENRWFAGQTLQRYLAQAGYRPLVADRIDGPVLPIDSPEQAFPEIPDRWSTGAHVRAVPGGVAIRFVGASDDDDDPDGSLSDCTGTAIGAEEIGEMTFRLDAGRLVCSVGDVSVTLAGGEGTLVREFGVRAGVDDDGDGEADRLVDLAETGDGTPVALVPDLDVASARESGGGDADADDGDTGDDDDGD